MATKGTRKEKIGHRYEEQLGHGYEH